MMAKVSVALLLAAGALFFGLPAAAQETPEALIKESRVTAALRYRYEFVDQDGPAPVAADARAGTLRAQIGFETGKYRGFQGFVEAQFVQNMGADDFNDTLNGQTRFPVVADPDSEEINQGWLSWNGEQGFGVKLGRQAINLDNQRFIGTVDWRQNDQTFDALRLSYTGLEKASLHYGYIGNVNRVFGGDHPLGDLDSDIHFVNASYRFADALTLGGYGYWLAFDRLPARSSRSIGVRASGKTPLAPEWTFSYDAELAHQSDYRNNASGYDALYYHIAPSFSAYGWTWGAGYEVLGGDGTDAFQTPLATLHKFNGWADKFLDTPVAGLRDAYVSASYKVSGAHNVLDGVELMAVYHDFSGDQRADFGHEADFSIGKSFALPPGAPFKKINLLAKYADYKAGDRPYTDTQKAWLQVGVNF